MQNAAVQKAAPLKFCFFHIFRSSGLKMVQVLGTWRWSNYMSDQSAVQGKLPLRINIDESPMPIVYTGATGNICKSPRVNAFARRPATRGEQRMHFTFVAMICDVPWIQNLLPQVLVVPQRCLPENLWRKIVSELPHNTYLLRNKSMWLNTGIFRSILRLLRKILHHHHIQRRYKVILYLDAFGGHISIGSLQQMHAYHYWFVLLPASLTWLLQPLDVKTFALVKRFLRQRFLSYTSQAQDGPHILKALRDLIVAIERFFTNQDWSCAFIALGLSGIPATSKTLLRELVWDAPPPVSRERPDEEAIRENTPRGRCLNAAAVRGAFPRQAPAPAI